MVSRSKGPRCTTRRKFTKPHRERGLSKITRVLTKFEVGEKANIIIDPSIHHGAPYHRFHGRCGTVMGMQGTVYQVQIFDGKKEKTLLIAPEHLRKTA